MGTGKPPTSHRDRVIFGRLFVPAIRRDPRDYQQEVAVRPPPSKFRGNIAWEGADADNFQFTYDFPFDLS